MDLANKATTTRVTWYDERERITNILMSCKCPERWRDSYRAYLAYIETQCWYIKCGLLKSAYLC